MNFDARREMLGSNIDTLPKIIAYYSASEVKAKIEAWEKAQEEEKRTDEIKVGDEVLFENDVKAVVTALDPDEYGFYDILFANGETNYVSQDDVTKTGRHFDQIAEVMEQMREKE